MATGIAPVWNKALIVFAMLIFLVAFVVRFVGYDRTPPSLYWEEVALGYDAYSILKTGKDHHGNPWPIVAFSSFGDYKPSLYFYAAVPSVAAFGLTELGVRLPAIISSALTAVAVLWWAKKLSGSNAIAGWSAFIFAVQPWSWLIGKVGFEVNLATLLLIAGSAFVLVTTEQIQEKSLAKSWLSGFFAVVLLALSMYAYHGARVLAPLFAVWIILVTFPWKSARKIEIWKHWLLTWIPLTGLAMILISPILLSLHSPVVLQRAKETSLLTNLAPVEASVQAQNLSGNTRISRLLFHRYVFWGRTLAESYLSHFSPSFLFGRGDNNTRHATHYFGMLAPWEMLTLLAGFYGWVFKGKRKNTLLLFGLIALSPVAAMITTATPHALRALPLASWLAIVSGAGIVQLLYAVTQVRVFRWLRETQQRWSIPATLSALCLGIVASTIIFWHYLWYIYPVDAAAEWQYGYRQVFEEIEKHSQSEEPLYVSLEYQRPAMYLFFMQQIDPKRVQAAELLAEKNQQEFLELENWKFYFGQDKNAGLHAAPPHLVPQDREVEVLATVTSLDGRVLWVVWRQ